MKSPVKHKEGSAWCTFLFWQSFCFSNRSIVSHQDSDYFDDNIRKLIKLQVTFTFPKLVYAKNKALNKITNKQAIFYVMYNHWFFSCRQFMTCWERAHRTGRRIPPRKEPRTFSPRWTKTTTVNWRRTSSWRVVCRTRNCRKCWHLNALRRDV